MVSYITQCHIGNKNMHICMEMHGRFVRFLDSRLTKKLLKHLCISGSSIHIRMDIDSVCCDGGLFLKQGL